MNGRYVAENDKRRLYAESMGRCMNPSCKKELFCKDGSIAEKARIIPYCETADNSFKNLVLLCPNCHTQFDMNHVFTPEEVLNWKKIRLQEQERFFSRKFETFNELKVVATPLLERNKAIFENYYLTGNSSLWNKFEIEILANNRKLKELFSSNLVLFQTNRNKDYSNLECVKQFLNHVDEFETTRADDEKMREILFPAKINSMFGIAPVEESIMPSTESLESLIAQLMASDRFKDIVLGVESPYLQMDDGGALTTVHLNDTPRLRQLYMDYGCFRGAKVRLDQLNFALKYIRKRNFNFKFVSKENLREVFIQNIKMIFVYEYCLSYAQLSILAPEENCVIVNLHNWNGESCISSEAYKLAETMNVRLLSMEGFYAYIRKLGDSK